MENINWNFRCTTPYVTSVDVYATESESWQRFKELYPRWKHEDFVREEIKGLALFDW